MCVCVRARVFLAAVSGQVCVFFSEACVWTSEFLNLVVSNKVRESDRDESRVKRTAMPALA